jgi:hypothetical protein
MGRQMQRVVPSTQGAASSVVTPVQEPMLVSHVRPVAHFGEEPPEQGVEMVRLKIAKAPLSPLLNPATGARNVPMFKAFPSRFTVIGDTRPSMPSATSTGGPACCQESRPAAGGGAVT